MISNDMKIFIFFLLTHLCLIRCKTPSTKLDTSERNKYAHAEKPSWDDSPEFKAAVTRIYGSLSEIFNMTPLKPPPGKSIDVGGLRIHVYCPRNDSRHYRLRRTTDQSEVAGWLEDKRHLPRKSISAYSRRCG